MQKQNFSDVAPFFLVDRGEGPLVAAAIHDGHAVRAELEELFALDEQGRRREEDPFTQNWTVVAGTRILASRSRFEVDLNRPRNKAVYKRPEDAWGLRVWKTDLPEDVVARSLQLYDEFYTEVKGVFSDLEKRFGHFVVFDLHTYNHRREGIDAAPADVQTNPEVNIGTGTLNREMWAPLLDRFIADLRAFDFQGRHLDVRENVKFRGGQFSRWIHEQFPTSACSIAIEWKKFFMDEWSGKPDSLQIEAISAALQSTVPGVLEELKKR